MKRTVLTLAFYVSENKYNKTKKVIWATMTKCYSLQRQRKKFMNQNIQKNNFFRWRLKVMAFKVMVGYNGNLQ